eukprot:TRINITY_DN3771_c0_g1_i1.p1 TRINITY_DN3771_c0_g1~~TRINITY_DN3771_c0_g1_i1.p1  ORF type:complete len:185 (+),score=25.05 TRINITY_DN3771_c0_g1_i1:65-556(+)
MKLLVSVSFGVLIAIASAWDGVIHQKDWDEAQVEDLSAYADHKDLLVFSTWRPDNCEQARQVKHGDVIDVKYVVKLTDNSGYANAVSYKFRVGFKEVIESWDLAMIGACVGENRRIIAPPHLAYGENEYAPDKGDDDAEQLHIAKNSVVVFDTQVLSVEDGAQ